MKPEDTVCAIVVTYNRKDLLLECLKALEKQTRSINAIYLLDNASTDRTPQLLLKKGYLNKLPPNTMDEPWEKTCEKNGISINYVRMPENIGGAGGFYNGIKKAYQKGYDWLWVMDDDTINTTNSLKVLFDKMRVVEEPIGFACSKVMWNEDEVHLQNMPSIQNLNSSNIPFNKYDKEGVLSVEASTFVSNLISRDAVKSVGLPLKEFFIWADDVEYTNRITKNDFLGLYVSDSIVYHKTKENNDGTVKSINEQSMWKNYYGRRNELYMRRSNSHLDFMLFFIKYLTIYNFNIIMHVKENKLKFLWINTKATLASLFFNPKIEYV